MFGVLRGGNVNNSNNAGPFYFNVNNNLTNTNVNIGFRLSLIYIAKYNPQPLLKISPTEKWFSKRLKHHLVTLRESLVVPCTTCGIYILLYLYNKIRISKFILANEIHKTSLIASQSQHSTNFDTNRQIISKDIL